MRETFYSMKKVLYLFFLCTFFLSFEVEAEEVFKPLGVSGRKDVSTAVQLRFRSLYPLNLPESMQTSPHCKNSDGELIRPRFYLLLTDNLPLPSDVYFTNYVVPCRLFVGDSNLITIVPLEPLKHNRSYSVCFYEFPLLKPDVNAPNGFSDTTITTEFIDLFTTIDYPTHVVNTSFQKTQDIVWTKNESIDVYFNKAIHPRLDKLADMFKLYKINGSSYKKDSLVFDVEEVPTDIALVDDNRTVRISLRDVFYEYGKNYYLDTHLEHYLGETSFNRSYPFRVAEGVVVDVDPYTPNGTLPSYCINAGFGGYRKYNMGDTARLALPNIAYTYYLAAWELPEGLSGDVLHSGKELRLIFDENNFFSNAKANPAMKNAVGLTIKARYELNPIDTLVISIAENSALASIDSAYKSRFIVKNCTEKLSDSVFTYFRYSYAPLIVEYDFSSFSSQSKALATNFYDISGSSLGDTSGAVVLHRNLPPTDNSGVSYNLLASTSTGSIAINVSGSNIKNGGTAKIACKTKIEEPVACNSYSYNACFVLSGNKEREFEATVKANPCDLLVDNITINGKSLKLDPSNKLTNTVSASDREVLFSVSLNNTDYEIYSIGTKLGNDYCKLDNKAVCKHYDGNDMYRDYNLSGFSSVAGKLKVSHDACQNTLYVYVRRKIVKFDFEFYIDNSPSKAREVPAFDVAHLKFFDLSPLNLHNYKFSKENPTVLYDIYRRYEPDYMKVWDYGPEHKTVEIPCREKSAVYYFSGESFKFYPYFMENSGYSLYYYAQEPIHKSNRVGDTIYITNLRAADKNIIGVGKSFKLDFIGVDNYTEDANKMTNYFRVSETTNNKEYEVWNSEFLSNPDNGAGLLTLCGADPIHNHTTSLSFVFSEDYDINSFVKNVRIADKKSTSRNVRADSCQLDRYPLVYDPTYSYSSNYNVISRHNNTIDVELFNTKPSYNNPRGFHQMCNLQLFDIIIDNTATGGIRSANDSTKTLSNIDKTKEKVFTISTVSPSISILTYYFANIDYKDKGDHNDEPKVYVYNFTIADIINEITNKQYSVLTDFYPIVGYIAMPIDPNKLHTPYKNKFFGYRSSRRLFNNQRILHTYHWIDKDDLDNDCEINSGAIAKKLSTKAYSLNQKAEKTSAFAFKDTMQDIITSEVKKEFEGSSCASNDLMGFNTMYLTKYPDIKNLNSMFSYSWYNGELEKQNWELWGAGVLYKSVERKSYSSKFEVYRDATKRIILIPQSPNFFTAIEITLGIGG
ncbi:MAG: hypothetical protein GX372_02845 [Ignavibacteria bacterium]|jgi:hypothetical protein|nr:hypothetical protein [Ignavibacteria bacterium]